MAADRTPSAASPSPRYRTIVADPPWRYDEGFHTTSHNRRTGEIWNGHRSPLPYPSMSSREIAALPVSNLAAADCFLFLWTTNRYLGDAFHVAEAWGFAYAQMIVWAKDKSGPLPAAIAPVHAEFLLFAKRGNQRRLSVFPSSVIEVPRTKRHSTKPEIFLDLIESVSPGPYLEMFSRRARLGWDTWGDEALNHVELSA